MEFTMNGSIIIFVSAIFGQFYIVMCENINDEELLQREKRVVNCKHLLLLNLIMEIFFHSKIMFEILLHTNCILIELYF